MEDCRAPIVKSGPLAYELAGFGILPAIASVTQLINDIDGLADDKLRHYSAWSGINMLAEALSCAQRSKS